MADSSGLTWDPDALRANAAWLRPLVRSLVAEDEVDDVLQDTWLRALQTPPRQQRAWRSWLRRVATNAARGRRRADARRHRHEARAARADEAPSTAALVDRLAAQRAVTDAVLQLAEPYRSAVLLRHDRGMSMAEIARHTGVSEANARQRVHRGLQQMRAQLERSLGARWRQSPALLAMARPAPTVPGPSAGASTAAPAGGLTLTWIAVNKAPLLAAVGIALAGVATWFAIAPGDTPPVSDSTIAAEGAQLHDDTPAPAAPAADPSGRRAVLSPQETGSSTAAPTSRRAGRVLDTRGQPVGQVPLGARPHRTWTTFNPLTRSDANGAFQLEGAPQDGILTAGAPWVELHTHSFHTAPGADVLVVVAPAVELRGTVADAGGTPLEEVDVLIEHARLVDFPQQLEHTVRPTPPRLTTDDRGAFVALRVPRGMATLVFRKPGFATVRLPVDATTPTTPHVVLQAIEGGARHIAGRVFDHRGAPMANATVGLGGRQTTTDANAAYRLILPPGSTIHSDAVLWAAAAGHRPARVDGFGARVADRTNVEHDLHLEGPPLTLHGVVVDAEDTPMSQLLVFPFGEPTLNGMDRAEDLAMPADAKPITLSGPRYRAITRTGGDGAFALGGLGDRPYRLHIYDPRDGWAFTTSPLRPRAHAHRIPLPADVFIDVEGRVVDRDGNGLGGVTVHRWVLVHAADGGRTHRGGEQLGTTDGDGHFRFARVPRCGVRLDFGGVALVSRSVELEHNPSGRALQVELLRRCHVRVQLTDPRWASASISFVDAHDRTLGIQMELATSSASYTVTDLVEGKSEVLAVSEDAAAAIAELGGERLRIPIRLVPGEITQVVH